MIQKTGKTENGRETMMVPLEDDRKIEVYFSFFGGGVLSTLAWGGFQAVNEEDLTGLQVHESGCFRNEAIPRIGDFWASIYCGQAGCVYVPFSEIAAGKEGEVEKKKIVWIGKYPNDFGYEKNIVIMEGLN